MARNVNRACGIPKIIAIRSITNVDWIKRFRRTNQVVLVAIQRLGLFLGHVDGHRLLAGIAVGAMPHIIPLFQPFVESHFGPKPPR